MRPETGPMRFGDDWYGVFIRGDNALGHMVALKTFLAHCERNGITNPYMGKCRSLVALLESCQQHEVKDGQDMKPIEECRVSEL